MELDGRMDGWMDQLTGAQVEGVTELLLKLRIWEEKGSWVGKMKL